MPLSFEYFRDKKDFIYMSNPYFKFKKFTVFHDKCAMKVGTDGVLLGAWVDLSNSERILDIGTGTGLIALMMAQRSGGNAIIDAIDIDENAIIQAKENVIKSPFSNIACIHTPLQEYFSLCRKKYDLVVSNPPYFSSSLHSPVHQRTLARHDDSLSINELVYVSSKMLSEKGRVALVYPYGDKDRLISLANNAGLYLTRITNVYPTPASQPKRLLLEFSVVEADIKEDNLVIEKERHIHSDEFVALAKDFYLKL